MYIFMAEDVRYMNEKARNKDEKGGMAERV
jgi:hypothetical protein